MTMGIRDRYDRTQALIAVNAERERQKKQLEDIRATQARASQSTTTAGQAPSGTPPTTPSTPTTPAAPVTPTTTAPTLTTGTPAPRGGTEAHWEDDEDIRLPDPDRPGADTGWGAALGLMAPILSRYDADYTHDSHWGQHLVPATPATPATTPTAATPITPAGAAVPSVPAAVASRRSGGGDRGRGHGGDASRPRRHRNETA